MNHLFMDLEFSGVHEIQYLGYRLFNIYLYNALDVIIVFRSLYKRKHDLFIFVSKKLNCPWGRYSPLIIYFYLQPRLLCLEGSLMFRQASYLITFLFWKYPTVAPKSTFYLMQYPLIKIVWPRSSNDMTNVTLWWTLKTQHTNMSILNCVMRTSFGEVGNFWSTLSKSRCI
mgnify:FL=1